MLYLVAPWVWAKVGIAVGWLVYLQASSKSAVSALQAIAATALSPQASIQALAHEGLSNTRNW